MSELIRYYNLPFHRCSCRDENNQPTHIARNYKKFYELLKKGMSGIEALNELKIRRMCCRKRYLVIPVVPMIDRSKDRFFYDTKEKITYPTRDLKLGVNPPDFPLL